MNDGAAWARGAGGRSAHLLGGRAREKVSGTPKEDTREQKKVDRGAENGDRRGW